MHWKEPRGGRKKAAKRRERKGNGVESGERKIKRGEVVGTRSHVDPHGISSGE